MAPPGQPAQGVALALGCVDAGLARRPDAASVGRVAVKRADVSFTSQQVWQRALPSGRCSVGRAIETLHFWLYAYLSESQGWGNSTP